MVKNFSPRGEENFTTYGKNFQEVGKKFSKGGEKNFMDINTAINTNKAAAASQPPESKTDPPPDEEKSAAAALFSPEKLKTALSTLDKNLILKDNFFSKAPPFMAHNGLDLSYLAFVFKQTKRKDPDRSFDGMFFTLFFGNDTLEKYKIAVLTAAQPPPPPPEVECPVCGTLHGQFDDACPDCGLPRYSAPYRITLFQELQTFPPDKRDEYLRREQAVIDECGNDFAKQISKRADLNREFGLTVSI